MNDPNYGAMWQRPEDLVGTVLADRYQVQHILGEGGMGSVFLGEHITLRKRVAIKVLHHELCRDQTQVDRFLQEARAASMIGHENIVDIVDFGPVPGGSVFFAMEYLEGEDLSDVLRRESRIPWGRARELMLQIVRALRAAHEKGIIHRDLKPANCFLVKRSDGRDFVKLLDFGIAKVTDPESGDGGGLTRTGAVFGTAKYMAPEQACGEPADQRTDVYAAAICLYEFMTGQVPYDGDNFMRVLSRHLTEPLTLPSTMAPDAMITPAVEAVIVKALSKKPDDRYQDMTEFEEALRAIGPDGNLAHQLYEGPPMAGPGGTQLAVEAPGSTVWFQQAGQASQGPASQPPEGRGGTMLLDASSSDYEEPPFGTVKLGPHGFAGAEQAKPEATYMMDGHGQDMLPTGGGPGASAVTRNPPIGAMPPVAPGTTPPSPETRPPTHAPSGDRSDYTMFATEKRSPAKFIALLIGGAVVAILLGVGGAWALLGGQDEKPKTELPTKEIAKGEVPPPPEEKLPPVLEVPDEPEIPDDPPPEEPPPEDPPPEDPPPQPETETKVPKKPPGNRGNRGNRREPKVKDTLGPADITKGCRKANAAAQKCPGFLGKMTIKVTISASGRVASSKAQGALSGSSAAKCVAKAVKNKASFPKFKSPALLFNKTCTFRKGG